MFGLHWSYIAILLVVVLIIFGPGRLPELGGAVGKAMREFRKATSELTNEVTTAAQGQPATAPPPPAPVTVQPAPPPAPVTVVTSESAAKGSTSEANPPPS
jgi:sec-independent protein translocase protein TatA